MSVKVQDETRDAFGKLISKYSLVSSFSDLKPYSIVNGYVGPGWFPILERLFEGLIELGWDRDVLQIKEKFGVLRISIGQTTTLLNALVREAEEESAHVCEDCGSVSDVTTEPKKNGSWIRTLCRFCRDFG